MKKLAVLLAAIIIPAAALAGDLESVLRKSFVRPAVPVSDTRGKIGQARITSVYPTFFFVEDNGKLLQLARVEITGNGSSLAVRAVRPGGLSYDTAVGGGEALIKIPDLRQPGSLELQLLNSGKTVQTLKFDWKPEKLWKVYVSFVSHFDLGYTDYQDKVAEKRNKITETALGYAEQTKDWPEDSRYRWTAEAAWDIKNFLREHPEKAGELKKLAQEGRLEVCAKFSHMHAETAGYEMLFRELYYAERELEPLLGVEIVTANHTDVDGYTWGEATVLPGSGVKYLLFNPNWSYRGGNIVHDTKFPQAFFWQGPDEGKILTWRAKDSYGEAPFLNDGFQKALPKMTAWILGLEKKGYRYDAIHLTRTGPEWDNTIPKLEPCMTIREWDRQLAYPRLISATPKMFFSHLEKNFSEQVPVAKGDMPDWWADGVITEAKEEGLSRELHHRLPELEWLAYFARMLGIAYRYPHEEIEDAYNKNILFDEHTWGFHNPRKKEHQEIFGTKAGWLHEGYDATQKMRGQAAEALARQVAGQEPTLVVFNPLSWTRSDVVAFDPEIEWLKSLKTTNFKIVDAQSGAQVPIQAYELPNKDLVVYFIAKDVPGLGYKNYRLMEAAEGTKHPIKATAGNNKMENDRFVLSFDKENRLTGIKDKKLDRELLSGPAGQFVYRKQDRYFSLIDYKKTARAESIEFSQGPVYAQAKIKLKDPANASAALVQEVRIYDGLDWIDISNHYENYSNELCEARYFVFPFKVPDFEMWVETPYGKMRPYYDQLPDYAKFYVVSHYVELRSKSEDFSVIWSTRQAPMVELGRITKKANHLTPIYRPGIYPWNPDKPTVYSEIMNNYQNTNFSFSQAGTADWQYRIAALNDEQSQAAHQSGWELSSPLIPVQVDSGRGVFAPAGSFVKLSPENVMVTELKFADNGDGLIIRLYEAAGRTAKANLELPFFKVSEALLTDGVEREQSKLAIAQGKIQVELSPHQVKTIKVRLAE